jgi:hypothetical protein
MNRGKGVPDMLYNPGVEMETPLPVSLLGIYPHELDELYFSEDAFKND